MMISEILLVVAGISAVIGAIGMLRFRDFYARSHPATMVSVGGVALALFVLMLGQLFSVYSAKILIIIVLSMLTSPAAIHAVAQSAYRDGVRPKKLAKNQMETRPGGGRK